VVYISPIKRTWKKYYFKLPEEMPFYKAKAVLTGPDFEISSPEVSLPSERVHLEWAKESLKEEELKLKELIEEMAKEERTGYGERR
jgi:hypothetical protein